MNFVGISVEPSSFNIIVKQRTLSILIELRESLKD